MTILEEPGKSCLGALRARASGAAGGTYLATIDDDDVYAPEHISDLVLARRYSGAELVGKCTEVVYLAKRDRTVVLRGGPSGRGRTYPVGCFSSAVRTCRRQAAGER